VRARYTAGKYGLTERIKVVATRPATLTRDRTSDALQGAERPELDIKVPGLSELDPAANHFAYGGGCLHSETGNKGDGVARYVTNEMAASLVVLNGYYQKWTGNNLSFNDASLPYGGFFDNLNGGGLDSGCHHSHRRGMDIDVNREDAAGENNLRTKMVERGGSRELLLNVVDVWAEKSNLVRLIEKGSIHYRIKTKGGGGDEVFNFIFIGCFVVCKCGGFKRSAL